MGFIESSINMFAVVWKCQLFGTMEITTVSILSYSKSILQSTAKRYTGNFFFFLLLSRTANILISFCMDWRGPEPAQAITFVYL